MQYASNKRGRDISTFINIIFKFHCIFKTLFHAGQHIKIPWQYKYNSCLPYKCPIFNNSSYLSCLLACCLYTVSWYRYIASRFFLLCACIFINMVTWRNTRNIFWHFIIHTVTLYIAARHFINRLSVCFFNVCPVINYIFKTCIYYIKKAYRWRQCNRACQTYKYNKPYNIPVFFRQPVHNATHEQDNNNNWYSCNRHIQDL